MYHSGSEEDTKEVVLDSLRDPSGLCRIVFCTNALGMGIDVKGLQRIIHYGAPATIEEYVQEYGRAGRNGRASEALLLWNGHLLSHASPHMKTYVQLKDQCLREYILAIFDSTSSGMDVLHNCCENCTKCCACSMDCSSNYEGLAESTVNSPVARSERAVSATKCKDLERRLMGYSASYDWEGESRNFMNVPNVPKIPILARNAGAIFCKEDLLMFTSLKIDDKHVDNLLDIFRDIFSDVEYDNDD
eukprot:m.91459 g.91459  ORF g.91459 m.91459 type:complete len:246 (+) comp36696_c0_seq10:1019-1756(+)